MRRWCRKNWLKYTTVATGLASWNSLKENPAELMRPKAPKSGKHILIENIKPVWRRMSFTKKVTARNIGLNKKRLVMSLIGILGCTALVVTAFGARNAVNTVLNGQFGEVFHYDVTVGYDSDIPSEELLQKMSDTNWFENSMESLRRSGEARAENNDSSESNSVYVVSPKTASGFSEYISLIDPKSKDDFDITDDSVIITQKLSLNLGIQVGDTIWVNYLDDKTKHEVVVTDITKNYAFNYVYLGKNSYQTAFGKAPEYNQFFAIMNNGHNEDEVKEYVGSADDVAAISFTGDLMGNIETSIGSVNNIIMVLIIAAALLAFVVIYNLTNINIGERQRELATLKVLGFYNKETYSYIFRETIILSIAGSLIGLFVGLFLYRSVVATVEPDMLLLSRDLTILGYLATAVLTMFFTWIVNQCMKPRIKNIDMLESLKSVE